MGEADKIVTIMTHGSGKIRAVAKGIRKTKSKFGARLEPFTHVSLMMYHGRGALDTVTQAEIISSHPNIGQDLARFAAGETMVEAVDKVAQDHERNPRLALLLLAGLRALDAGPADPAAVAESFMLKLLSQSGFHPSLNACAVCGEAQVTCFSFALGGAVCSTCAEPGSASIPKPVLEYLIRSAEADLAAAGDMPAPDPLIRKQTRTLLYGFAEYYMERRMRSVPMLVRTAR